MIQYSQRAQIMFQEKLFYEFGIFSWTWPQKYIRHREQSKTNGYVFLRRLKE